MQKHQKRERGNVISIFLNGIEITDAFFYKIAYTCIALVLIFTPYETDSMLRFYAMLSIGVKNI